MATIEQFGIEDRKTQSYRISPTDTDRTCQAVCIENTVAEPVPVSLTPNPTTFNIFNFVVGTSEVSQALTANVRQLIIKNKDNGRIQIAFIATESATKYLTIHPGATLSITDVNIASGTLYLVSNKASQNIEVLEII